MKRLEHLLDTSDLLVTFVRVAITGVPENVVIPSDFDWNTLYFLSERHKLTCVVWRGIELSGLTVPQPLFDKWYVRTQQALSKSLRFEYELTQIQKAFEDAGIDYVLLKGVVLQKYWPNNCLREFSDHDILIRKEQREAVRDVMISLGYYNDLYGGSQDVYKKEPIYDVEIHTELLEEQLFYSAYFADIWNRVIPAEGNMHQFTFNPVDFYLYFLVHFCKHAQSKGSGLRFYIDLYTLQTQLVFSAEEQKQITSFLSKFDLEEYIRRFTDIKNCFFQEKREISPRDKEMIFSGSVYGGHTQSIYNSINKYGTRQYVLRRLFPPRSVLEVKYKVLHNLPFLLPICWIYRFIHHIFNGFHRQRIFREIREVKRFSGKEVQK